MSTFSGFIQRNYWACMPLSLGEAAELLGEAFGLVEPEFGSEDSEEWLEGFANNGVTFYVCRNGGPAAPLRFIINPYQKNPKEFGHRLASCFKRTISYGDVAYLGDDKYRYTELARYEHDVF